MPKAPKKTKTESKPAAAPSAPAAPEPTAEQSKPVETAPVASINR